MKNLILATSNHHKVKEIQPLFPAFNLQSLKDIGWKEEIEETGQTFLENAEIKARAVHTQFPDNWIMAEDSGLQVDALGGKPGIYSARYPGVPNPSREDFCLKILGEMKGIPAEKRTARYVCGLVLISPDSLSHSFKTEAYCEGTIAEEMRGDLGFGYDPIFYYPPYQKMLAEVSLEEKNKISHRSKAIRQLLSLLEKELPNIFKR